MSDPRILQVLTLMLMPPGAEMPDVAAEDAGRVRSSPALDAAMVGY
jgi:hypothetical protein